jgi:hypothetical protein
MEESTNSESYNATVGGGGLAARRESLGTRPPFPTRSSTNYVNALAEAEERAQESLQKSPEAPSSPVSSMKGVEEGSGSGVPPGTWRPKGLGRQQSWKQEDLKALMQRKMMEENETLQTQGYSSAGAEGKED